jgi:hypothetical protein
LDLVDTTLSWPFLHSSLEHLTFQHFFSCIQAPSIQLVCISCSDQSCLVVICLINSLVNEAPSSNSSCCVIIIFLSILSWTTA